MNHSQEIEHAPAPQAAERQQRGTSYAPLLAALRAIKDAPDIATAEAMVDTYTARFGRAFHEGDPPTNQRPTDWTYCVLKNFQRIVWGDRQWSDELVTNTSWVTRAVKTEILALAETYAPHAQVVGVAGGIGYDPSSGDVRATLRDDMERFLTGAGDIAQADITHVVDLARRAGLGKDAVTTARKLLVGYREIQTFRSTGDGPRSAELVRDIDWFLPLLALATRHGILTAAFANMLEKHVVGWRNEALPKSEAHRAATQEVARQQTIERGYRKLAKLYELKESMDARNGWTIRPAFTWRWEHDIATHLIEIVIPLLQQAADSGDAARINAALDHVWMRHLNKHPQFAGDPVALARFLEQQNKDGIAQGELLTDLISLTPIGPVGKLLAATPIELLKLASGQQSLGETFLAIAFKAASGPFDKWGELAGWTPLRAALMNGIKGAVEDAAKNIAKVAASKLSWDAKFGMWDEILQHAIASGIKDAFTSLPKDVFGNLPKDMRRAWLETFANGLAHFGFKKPVEDDIKRLVEVELAKQLAEQGAR